MYRINWTKYNMEMGEIVAADVQKCIDIVMYLHEQDRIDVTYALNNEWWIE